MAKIDLNTVSSGYLSQAALNANFTAIENEFQNKVLYRDNPSGEPNSMQSNLDMNGYYVLNAGNTSLADADNIAYTFDDSAAEARTISDKLNEFVSVKDFGAVGDGVTDDRAAINAALVASKSVYFPTGTYFVSGTPIFLPTGINGITLFGDGFSTKIVGGGLYGVLQLFNHDGVRISDMWLETYVEAFGCLTSFHAESSNIYVERCKFTTNGPILTNGIKMVMDLSTVGLDGMVIRDCIFDAPGRMGIEIQNHGSGSTVRYRNVTIENCKILRTGEAVGGGTSTGMGISFTGIGQNCAVLNNYLDQCTGPSIENIGASSTIISGNKINRAKARPIQTANTYLMSNNVISKNIVTNLDATLGNGLYLGSMANCVISNNYFDLTGKSNAFVEITSAGIANTGKNLFNGNVVRTNATYAVVVDSCPDNTITSNILDNSASVSNFATIRCLNASSTRNTVFSNYVAKGTGGAIFDNASSATGNIFADFYSLESGTVYVRAANGGASGSATYDPPSIAAGASNSTTVTVTGAAVRDYAQVSLNTTTGGLIVSAAITAANTATVTFFNPTGSPIDLGSLIILVRTTPFTA
jgi:hypothetical protein